MGWGGPPWYVGCGGEGGTFAMGTSMVCSTLRRMGVEVRSSGQATRRVGGGGSINRLLKNWLVLSVLLWLLFFFAEKSILV